jgi:cysteine-rich repeat protein
MSGCQSPFASTTDEGGGGTTEGSSSTGETTEAGTTAAETGDSASGEATTSDTEVCDGRCDPGDECPRDCSPPEVCGDGIVAGSEGCDDGNSIDGDGCDDGCVVTPGWPCGDANCGPGEDGDNCYVDCGVCGDGVVEGAEPCDDGPANADDGACRPGCVAGYCGDGAVMAGVEACDDGNTVEGDGCQNSCECLCGDGAKCGAEECDKGANNSDSAHCLSTCVLNVCGDGHVLVGAEACDEGADNSDDAGCKSNCLLNVCGDGHVWQGVEECDELDNTDEDDCSLDCDAPRMVFVTSVEFPDGNLGGLGGADAKCNDLAANGVMAVQGRKFRAWLSGSLLTSSPYYRIRDPEFAGWYKLVNGKLVARGWDDLVEKDDGGYYIDSSIIVSETGEATVGATWTNTTATGQRATLINNCQNWSSGLFDHGARMGLASSMYRKEDWTESFTSFCDVEGRLYCFEVRP